MPLKKDARSGGVSSNSVGTAGTAAGVHHRLRGCSATANEPRFLVALFDRSLFLKLQRYRDGQLS
jgi:hypothetical protein